VQPASTRFLIRALGVVAAALMLVGLFSLTTLYPRLAWWFEDSAQRILGSPLAMDHVLVIDVDEESMRRLQPQLGAWPFSRDVYARTARFLAEHGARAVAFDVLFAEPREGDDAFARALGRRDVLAAAALPYPSLRSPAYQEQLARAALFDAAPGDTVQAWPDLTLPLLQLTGSSQARIGVISVVADADGIVRRLPLLHQAYGKVLPNLALAALLASDPGVAPEIAGGELRLGTRAWPLNADGSVTLNYPSNAGALPVLPFFQLLDAEAGADGSAHIGDLVRDKIVFLGSSSAVLGDFALTPVGRLPGLHLNALFEELLLEGSVRRPAAPWLDALLLVLALAVPIALVRRGAAARPNEFLAGWGAIVLVMVGAVPALIALNQGSHWLFAALTGVVAHAFALVAWQFTLYREKQRLFYEKLAAQEANRMKTEFLNHMTHELRTPITAIMGFNKVNQLSDNLGREQRVHNSEIVGRNCEHLLALINNNLDLARIEAGQLPIERKPEDVSVLLEDLVSTLRIMAEEKRLLLSLKIEGRLPQALSVDAIRLRQVLLNLVGNAIKFTQDGGVVVEAGWDAGDLRICVRDTGTGIPPESADQVFEPFRRGAGERATGTGLGLAITRKLVELMGGKIRAGPAPGGGAEFEARIPAALATPAAPQRQPPPQSALQPLSGRVLVAEDNENLRALVELYLRELGLECQLVRNGFEAVDAALAGKFDVLLMDLEMPVMDGFEATHVLRERGYEGPIIALTAHRDGLEIERARREGCDDVLNKPVTIDNLRERIGSLLGGRGIARPRAARERSIQEFSDER
jgi:signal transduction histidine kinase/CheY-like chemotaxis protein